MILVAVDVGDADDNHVLTDALDADHQELWPD